jgi:hypothetical protein
MIRKCILLLEKAEHHEKEELEVEFCAFITPAIVGSVQLQASATLTQGENPSAK